jgi:uncharacterized protein with ParB-like and HNH nuclease domain
MHETNPGNSHPQILNSGITTVRELLSDQQLAIPDYQRPYKWTTRHINQLLGDIAQHRKKIGLPLGNGSFSS